MHTWEYDSLSIPKIIPLENTPYFVVTLPTTRDATSTLEWFVRFTREGLMLLPLTKL